VTGTGTISVRGGTGGSGSASGTCGGGGGSGGGIVQITAPAAGPQLVTLVEGGPGGAPCGGGGQRGEAGAPGALKRP
jgi:loricrin